MPRHWAIWFVLLIGLAIMLLLSVYVDSSLPAPTQHAIEPYRLQLDQHHGGHQHQHASQVQSSSKASPIAVGIISGESFSQYFSRAVAIDCTRSGQYPADCPEKTPDKLDEITIKIRHAIAIGDSSARILGRLSGQ